MRLPCSALLASLVISLAACGGGDPGGPDGGTEGEPCGGFAGLTCDPDQYCDFPDNSCGAADGQGTCRARPTSCGDNYQPTCACDGTTYSNPCDAAAAGSDLNDNGSCTPPTDAFACGHRFCASFTEYCEILGSDVAGVPSDYDCPPVPAGCGGTLTCACLADERCGELCEGEASDLTLICPGG